jgi:hypothetical protein
MMGFVTSIVQEATGHGGTLAQLGITTPSPGVLGALCALVGGATLVGTGHTAYKLATKKMTAGDIARCACVCARTGACVVWWWCGGLLSRARTHSLTPALL